MKDTKIFFGNELKMEELSDGQYIVQLKDFIAQVKVGERAQSWTEAVPEPRANSPDSRFMHWFYNMLPC